MYYLLVFRESGEWMPVVIDYVVLQQSDVPSFACRTHNTSQGVGHPRTVLGAGPLRHKFLRSTCASIHFPHLGCIARSHAQMHKIYSAFGSE
jgi:hypothetical protein